jgi:hypothetical protein
MDPNCDLEQILIGAKRIGPPKRADGSEGLA